MFFGKQFYPTPIELANKALQRVDFERVKFILEPSAGRGDFITALKPLMHNKTAQVNCIEIDSDLRAVLRNRGFIVVGNDFMQFKTWQKYDLCVMNPPFNDGDVHLLKAMDVMKSGGQIVCILNAETIKNPYTNTRMDLLNRLDEYGAEIEYIEKAFAGAERKTDVEIALVYIDIPDIAKKDITSRLREATDTDYESDTECSELAANDVIRVLVKQFEMSCEAGVQIFEKANTLRKYIPDVSNGLISVNAISSEELEISETNKYIRQLRYEFWKRLFRSDQMSVLMTNEIRDVYTSQLNKMRDYDFNLVNIKQMQLELSKSLVSNTEKAIIDMFDKLTYQGSMDNSKNIHYYNGWKTNKAFIINKRVIVPMWGLYDGRWGGSWSFWKASDFLVELEKVLNYLDGGLTGGKDARAAINDIKQRSYCGEFVKFKYFLVSFKKKGTMHIQFDNFELLKKFNIFGSQKKGWLPPSYGKKKYTEMTDEEKAVVKSFEGEREYGKTMSASSYYLGNINLKMLCG